MHRRRNINSFSAAELRAFRDAMRELQRRTGAGSYLALAGMHGHPQWLCSHGDPTFLGWHRVYILRVEQALQRINSSIVLPYWDWTAPVALTQGIPAAFVDESYTSGGALRPNPLRNGPIQGTTRLTVRSARSPLFLEPIMRDVEVAMRRTTFLSFSSWLEGPHGQLHVWAGGDMATIRTAAYDPIFWAHHCAVDRLWAIWQRCNPSAVPSASVAALPLPGFPGWRLGHTLDLRASWLDYSYDDLATAPCNITVPRAATAPLRAAPAMEAMEAMAAARRDHEDKTGVPPRPGVQDPRIVAEVTDIFMGGDSFPINVFVRDESDPQAEEVLARTFFVFGAGPGGRPASPGRHDEHERITYRVDVTEEVAQLGLLGRPLTVRAEPAEPVVVPAEVPPLPPGVPMEPVPVPEAVPMLVGEARLLVV